MKRVLLFTALIIWSAVASAVVYKWSDAEGKVHYGDRPPDGVKAEIVEGLGTHVYAQPAATPAPARAAAQPAAAAAKDKPLDAAAHDAQCSAAQARLKQATEGRHLFKAGPNGERDYLTSDQIDAERADAKKEVDTVCSASN